MPSTARLLAAIGSSDKIHAYKPDEDDTLCGLTVVFPEDWEDEGMPPARSADVIGRRFYTGVHRLMCRRCTGEAVKARSEGLGVPLQAVR